MAEKCRDDDGTACGWDTDTEVWWKSEVAKYGWRESEWGGYELKGPCPRCHHERVYGFAPTNVILLVEAPDARAEAEAPQRIDALVECECKQEHPGRPEEKSGCGQAGDVEAEVL